MDIPFSESYKIKMVEPLRKSTRKERQQWIKEAKYKLFNL
jgi:tryptophanase